MSADGIYEIIFATWQSFGAATVRMEDGRFSGATDRGTLLAGTVGRDDATGRELFEMTVTIPPGVETVTGILAGYAGRTLTVSGHLPPQAPERRFSISLAGKAIDVALRFKCPIPPSED